MKKQWSGIDTIEFHQASFWKANTKDDITCKNETTQTKSQKDSYFPVDGHQSAQNVKDKHKTIRIIPGGGVTPYILYGTDVPLE